MNNDIFQSCLKKEISMYYDFCKESFCSNTCAMYIGHLKSFDRYLCQAGYSGGYIGSEIIDGWLSTLSGFKNFTITGYLTTLRGLLKYLAGHGVSSYIPPTRKKIYDYIPYIFSEEEMERIFDVADNYEVRWNNKIPYIQLEFPMVLRILCGCGTRLVETLNIQMKDVDLEKSVLTMRTTKWNKERFVPMTSQLGDMLNRYCLAMGLIGMPEAYLFPRKSFSEPLTHYDMRNRFNLLLRLAGITLEGRVFQERGPCMHCFRHGFVFRSFKKLESEGIRIDDAVPILSIYLGHFDLTETEKYMKFSSQLFPEELEKYEQYTEGLFPELNMEELV